MLVQCTDNNSVQLHAGLFTSPYCGSSQSCYLIIYSYMLTAVFGSCDQALTIAGAMYLAVSNKSPCGSSSCLQLIEHTVNLKFSPMN